jgi:hypothetical protein
MPPKSPDPLAAGCAVPPNVFIREFRRQKTAADNEPDTAAEAETAGSWKKVPAGELGYATLRRHESLARGDRPYATFFEPHLALYAAAVLPSTGRDPVLKLGTEETRYGHPVLREGRIVGYVQVFDQQLIAAMNAVDGVTRSPESLALMLDATSGAGLEHAGRILAEGLAEPEDEEPK